MSLLLNILLLYEVPMIFTSNIDCKKFNNCYECLNNPQCLIFNNSCNNDENKTLNKKNWYNKFEQYCIIENNDNLKYCGLIEISKKKVKIVKDNFLAKNNLFCKYNFTSSDLNDNSVKIISNVDKLNINLIIEVEIDDNNKMIYNITEKSISEKIKNFKKISIYYYHNNIPEKDDFNLEIKIKKKITYSDVAIFIFGCFGIIVIFLAIFLFVFIVKKLSKKKKNNNKKIDIISNNSNNNNNENICNNICKQTNKYKKHFILKRIKYNTSVTLFNQKCPICIEEIKINDDVIILTCNHGFHMVCITEWIKKNVKTNRYCPICHLKFNQTKQNKNNNEEKKKENIIDNNKIIHQEISENKEFNENSPGSKNSNISFK